MSEPESFQALPEGFAMALAQIPEALNTFGHMGPGERAKYVERAHQVSSREEMRALVSELDHMRTL